MTENCPARILIADDDAEDLELMEEVIREVAPATELLKFSNGRMAQQYLESAATSALPGLVILDYNMPELNGAEVLLYMQNQDRLNTIPRVVLSTSSSSYSRRECLANGAREYIVKPDNINDLRILAHRLVAMSNSGHTGR